MSTKPKPDNYTYPHFIIEEKTGQIKVDLIDKASGRVVRHIPSAELSEIVRNFYSLRARNPGEER